MIADVGDVTSQANFGVNWFKGGVSAHASCCRQASVFFISLGFMRIATGRPVGPNIAVNCSNDAPCWQIHSYMFGL